MENVELMIARTMPVMLSSSLCENHLLLARAFYYSHQSTHARPYWSRSNVVHCEGFDCPISLRGFSAGLVDRSSQSPCSWSDSTRIDGGWRRLSVRHDCHGLDVDDSVLKIFPCTQYRSRRKSMREAAEQYSCSK